MSHHKIICGDGIEVMKEMKEGSVDLVVTDPPYKVSQKYGGGVDADNLLGVASILKAFPEISRVLKPNKFCFVFYDNRILPFMFEAIKGTDLVYRKQIFLYRRWGNANRWVGWMQCTDPCLIFVNGYSKPFSPKIKWEVKHDCYVKDKPEVFNSGHPAQKPLEMSKDIVGWGSDEGDTVLDPYVGSGTTLVAADELGRDSIGIDNQKSSCELAYNRLQNGFKQTKWEDKEPSSIEKIGF